MGPSCVIPVCAISSGDVNSSQFQGTATVSRAGCWGVGGARTLLADASPSAKRPGPLSDSLRADLAAHGSEASFAHLCGAAPVPASSGRTSRHRLNFAGNRAANRALHMIVFVRLRYCERTRSYMHRRLAEGKTKKKPSAASNASSPASSTAPSEPTSPPSQPALDIYRNVPGRFS